MNGQDVPAGRCGHLAPVMSDAPILCALRAGHEGWHEGDGGAPQWSPTTPAGWSPTDHQQEISKGRWQAAEQRFDEAYKYAVKSGTHLWTVMVMHTASDQALDAFSGKGDATPILDVDTIAGAPQIGCYVCEQSFEPRLRQRRCTGEPRRGGTR